MNIHRLRDINLVLLGLTAILACLLLYQILKPMNSPLKGDLSAGEASIELEEFPTLLAKKKTQENGNNYNNIVERNLFSSDREPPTGRSRSVTDSDEDEEGTTSYEGFELVGTILSDEDRSLALIRKGGAQGEVKSYHLRDSVDGMEVQEIYYDRIILSKSGKEIVLLLEPRDKEKQTSFSPSVKSIERRRNKPDTKKSNPQSWNPQQRKDQ